MLNEAGKKRLAGVHPSLVAGRWNISVLVREEVEPQALLCKIFFDRINIVLKWELEHSLMDPINNFHDEINDSDCMYDSLLWDNIYEASTITLNGLWQPMSH